jgi:hypothetical protein
MSSNTYVSTKGSITSSTSDQIALLLASDTTVIPNSETSLDNLVFQILLQNRDAILNDVLVTGTLNTECLSIDNQISIGDTSGSTFQVLQFITKDIYESNGPDQVIQDISYELIDDVSLSFRAKTSNGYYQLSVALNYLTSTYYNTFLKLGLFYYTTITDLGQDTSENLIGEYILGGENANFTRGIFSKTIFIDISHAANDTMHFYLKGKIETDAIGNDFSYVDVDDALKPTIIQTLSGNIITVAEFNSFT